MPFINDLTFLISTLRELKMCIYQKTFNIFEYYKEIEYPPDLSSPNLSSLPFSKCGFGVLFQHSVSLWVKIPKCIVFHINNWHYATTCFFFPSIFYWNFTNWCLAGSHFWTSGQIIINIPFSWGHVVTSFSLLQVKLLWHP